jgi:hypothetical protein
MSPAFEILRGQFESTGRSKISVADLTCAGAVKIIDCLWEEQPDKIEVHVKQRDTAINLVLGLDFIDFLPGQQRVELLRRKPFYRTEPYY